MLRNQVSLKCSIFKNFPFVWDKKGNQTIDRSGFG